MKIRYAIWQQRRAISHGCGVYFMDAIQYIAEQRIREAITKGEFENLQGSGKYIDNTEYFSVPEEKRIAYHILRNSGFVPEELQR